MKILITGGAGFIGSHIVEHIFKNTDWDIYVIDKLAQSSRGLNRIRDINVFDEKRIRIFTFDLVTPLTEGLEFELTKIDYIIHAAAETHVDKSISNPTACIYNNIMSTVQILEYARRLKSLKKFLYFSTDEVYGSAPTGISYKERDRKNPGNPYAASKSGAEDICFAYENTYKIPLIVINCMNAFGERQHVEKFIPKTIKNILDGNLVDIHVNKDGIPGSRNYIHARNIASATMYIIQKGLIGEIYNITGEKEVNNLEMVEFISKVLGKPYSYRFVDDSSGRSGCDFRYDLDGSKLRELGWEVPVNFEDSLKKCVLWTQNRPEWLLE